MIEFSLITPSLNSAETLDSCMGSAASQTRLPQHILVDGGSTDATVSIARARESHFALVLSEPDRGIYDALNKGIQNSDSDIVGILHADDMLADDCVIQDVATLFQDAGIDATYGDLEYVDRADTSKVVRRWRAGGYSPRNFYNGWMPPHPTFFVRRECYEKYGLYRLDLGTAADYELMLRFMLVHNIRVKYIPRVLVKMRVGGASNASLRGRLRANRMDRKAWAVNGLRPYPWTLVAKPLRKIGQWWV
jgi:glycosyltransferase